MAAQRKYKYSDELRERGPRMVLDARRDRASSKGAIKRIADQLGMAEALRNWVQRTLRAATTGTHQPLR